MKLSDLGLDNRQFRALRAQGIETVQDLLQRDPDEFAKRKTMWTELSSGLKRAAKHLPTLQEQIDDFLERGSSAREEYEATKAEQRANDPDAGLPHDERTVLSNLRIMNAPKPLRLLRRQLASDGRFKPLKTIVQQSEKMLIYPYGIHNWVGLKEWGLEGYLKAARSSWTVLPLHLNRVLSEQRQSELGEQGWKAVTMVALERQDKEVLALCRPHLKPEVQVAEAPIEKKKLTLEELTTMVREKARELRPPEGPRPEPLQEQVDQALAGEEPRIFAGLDPERDALPAVQAIVQASKDLARPYSLAELEPTAGDLSWLKTWARSLRPYVVRGWLNSFGNPGGWSHSECLGVLLLFLASEEARRRGSEGQIWTTIPACFAEETRDELFTTGQPRGVTRQAIEAAARKLQVHHAFGREGRQSWYITAFLQFGFTRQKIPQLSLWLARQDQMTESCLQLLTESKTFQRLWDALKAYRKNPKLEEETKRTLEQNGFVLKEWIPEILASARRELSAELLDTTSGTLPLLDSPTLHWSPPESPSWALEYFELNAHDLSDSGYDVEVDGEPSGRIIRLSDGTLTADPPELRGALMKGELEVEFLSDLGEDDREARAVLWEAEEDIVGFDADRGTRLSRLSGLSPNRALVLALEPGLTVVPPAAAVTCVGTRVLHYIQAGWSAQTVVQDGDGRVIIELAAPPQPGWVEAATLVYDGSPARLGERIQLSLRGLPRGVELEWARFEGKQLPVKAEFGGFVMELDLPVHLTGPTVSLRLCAREGERRVRFRRSAAVEIFDASICLQDEGWKRFDNLPTMVGHDLSQARCRFFLSHKTWKTPRDWAIMEGSSFAERPRTRAFKLGKPAGYGAPLTLRPGPYNPEPFSKPLVQSVVQHGKVIALVRKGGSWTLWLTRELDADEEHRLVFWGSDGEVLAVTPEQMTHCEGRIWRGSLPTKFESVQGLAVGLAFRGEALGTFWDDTFTIKWSRGTPRRTAGLARWFRLPLLDNYWRSRTREFVGKNPLSCLQAWLFDKAVEGEPELRLPEESDDWFCVVRQLFKEWKANSEEGQRVWDGLAECVDVPQLFNLLLQVDPIMTLKLVTRGQLSVAELRMLQIWSSLGLERGQLLQAAARDMQADERFVEMLCQSVVKGKVDSTSRSNIELACQVSSFSRLLTAIYLEAELAKQGKRR